MKRSKALRRARIREDMGLDQPPSKQRWYERDWFKAIELVAIIIGVAAITYEVIQRETVDRPLAEATLKELEAAERERARSIVASAMATTAEKIGALHALVFAGTPLSFLDASCPTWERVDDTLSCMFEAVQLTGLQLDYESAVRHINFRFENVALQVPTLRNWNCVGCYMSGLQIDRGEIADVMFHQSDLSNAWIFPGSVSNVLISNSNVSGLRFEAGALTADNFANAWFFDGFPPEVFRYRPPIGSIWDRASARGRQLSNYEIEALGIRNCGDPHNSGHDDPRRPPVACSIIFQLD